MRMSKKSATENCMMRSVCSKLQQTELRDLKTRQFHYICDPSITTFGLQILPIYLPAGKNDVVVFVEKLPTCFVNWKEIYLPKHDHSFTRGWKCIPFLRQFMLQEYTKQYLKTIHSWIFLIFRANHIWIASESTSSLRRSIRAVCWIPSATKPHSQNHLGSKRSRVPIRCIAQ